MICKQLGGSCDQTFKADTFEIAEMIKQQGMEMFKKGDSAHVLAMDEMKVIMKSPNAIQSWYKNKRAAFDALSKSL